MKIALLTDGVFPYVNGGMQRHSYYLLKYFVKNKIHVDLYHMTESDRYDIDKLELTDLSILTKFTKNKCG